MSSFEKFGPASSRLFAALSALPRPSAGLAAAFVFGASSLVGQTTIVSGHNLFQTDTTLDLGALTRNAGGAAFFAGAGTISATGTLENNILGPWAFIGSDASTRYVTLSSGNLASFTGSSTAAAFGWTSTNNNTFNYDVAGVQGNLGVGRQANTARYTGAAGTQNWGNVNTTTVTLNGLMNAGTGTLTFSEAGGTSQGQVAIGTNNGNELVLSAANADIAINIPIINTGANAGSLLITGPNTVSITSSGGISTYTGATTVASGTLLLSGAGNINSTSEITVNGPAARYVHTSSVASTRTITLSRGTVDGTGTLGTVNVADNTAAILANGNGGTGALTLGALNLAGDSTLSLRHVTGTRPLNVTGSLTTNPASGVVTINVASSGWTVGTHNLVGFGGFSGALSDFALGTVSGLNSRQSVGALALTSSNITLQINGDSPRWTGAQSSAWTTDTIGGARNWRLVTAGTATEYLAGDEVLFDDTATGSTTVDIATANVSPATTTFNNSTKNYTITSSGGFGIAGGTLIKSGSGTVTLATTNTYAGSTTINAGVLRIGDGTTNGSIAASSGVLNNGTLAYDLVLDQSYAGAITGAGSLTKSGSGTLTLTGANTYSGGTTVNAGKLVASVNGLNGGPVVVASGATITFTGNNQVGTSAVSGAGAILNDSANTIIFTGDHSGFTGAFTHASATNNTQFNSATSGSANASYTLTGGELIFAANGDYAVKFGSLASTAGNIRGGNAATGTATLEVGGLGTNSSIAGNLNNGGTKVIALSKVGAGTLTISGNNTYAGGTTVNAGTLTINGALTAAANAVTVSTGGTLAGNGTIAGAVTISGNLTPGDTVGVLTASGSLTLNTGSATRLEINGLARGTEYDGVNVGGAFTQDGALSLVFGSSIPEGSYTLFQIGGTSSGAFSAVTAASAATPAGVPLTNSAGVWTGTLNGVSLSFNSTTGVLTTTGGATHTELQTWRFDEFGVYDDTAGVLAGDTEDFDGDGLANLLEYALGSNPKVAGASPVTVSRTGNVLTLTYSRRNPADAALTYTVEGSDNLSSGFTPAAGSTNTVGSTSTYTDTVNLGTAGVRRFLRLSVTYTAP